MDRGRAAGRPGLRALVGQLEGDLLYLIGRPRAGRGAQVIGRRPERRDRQRIRRGRRRAHADAVAGADRERVGRACGQAGDRGGRARHSDADTTGRGDHGVIGDRIAAVERGRGPGDRGGGQPGARGDDIGWRPGNRELAGTGQPQVAGIRRPRIGAGRAAPAPGIDRGPGARDVDAEVEVRAAAAAGVAALRDHLAARDRLARRDVNAGEMRVARAVATRMVDDDRLAETRVDRIRAGELDRPLSRREDVLVGEAVVPAVVAVVVEIIAAARRLRVTAREAGVDAVAAKRDGAVEAADLVVERVVGIAVVEDRVDRVPRGVGTGEEVESAGQRRGGPQLSADARARWALRRRRLLRGDRVRPSRHRGARQVLVLDGRLRNHRARDRRARGLARDRRARRWRRGRRRCLDGHRDRDQQTDANLEELCAQGTSPDLGVGRKARTKVMTLSQAQTCTAAVNGRLSPPSWTDGHRHRRPVREPELLFLHHLALQHDGISRRRRRDRDVQGHALAGGEVLR